MVMKNLNKSPEKINQNSVKLTNSLDEIFPKSFYGLDEENKMVLMRKVISPRRAFQVRNICNEFGFDLQLALL